MKTLSEGKKLYAVIIAFLLMITFFITFHIIRNHYKYVFKNVITENTLTANLLSTLMYEHQKAATSILESYARRPLFIDAVKKKDFHRAIYHMKSLSEHHTEIDALFITDQYGTLWANYPVDRKGFGKNLAHRDWYEGVSKKWRPYISSVYRLIVLEKGLAVALSVPVFDRKGKVIGILSGAHRTAFLATFIKEIIIDPEKSITLLDQEGNIIFSNAVPYQEKITKYPDAHVREKAVAGVFIDMEIADAKEKGSISYVSIAPVRGIGWSVIVGQEKNAILKSLYGYSIRSAVTGFIIFLFLTVCLLYFRREYKYRKTKELQASEEKYRTLFEEALDGICLADAETGIIIDCNQALEALVCRERAELIGRPQTILHPPQDDKKAFSLTFKQHLTDKQGQILETQVVTKTGDIREVEIKANFVVLHGRKLLQGLFCDITERKRAEEALRESETRFREMFDDAPIGYHELDTEGRVTRINRTELAMLGYSAEEMLGRHVWEFIDEKDLSRKAVLDKLAGTLPQGRNLERTYCKKDGTRIPVLIQDLLLRDKDGKITGIRTTVQDITERKRAEEMLHQAEENFRRSLDESPLGVRIVTIEGETVYANRAMLNIYGYDSIEELRTTPVKKRYTPKSYAEFQIRMEKRRQGEYDPSEYEVNIVRKNGEVRHLQVFRKEILWNGEKKFQTIYQDITERKQAEEELRTSEAKLSNALKIAHLGHWEYDVASDLFTFSDHFYTMLRATAGQVGGYTMSSAQYAQRFVHPDDMPVVGVETRKAIETTDPHYSSQLEHRIIYADGETGYITVRIFITKDDQGRTIKTYGVNQDITERKRLEEILKKEQQELKLIIDSSPIIVFYKDKKGKFIRVNKTFAEALKLPEEEFVGKTVFDLYSAKIAQGMTNDDQEVIKSGHPKLNIIEQYESASGIRWVQADKIPICDKNGIPFGLIGFAQDITERKRAEEERERLLAEIAAKNQELESFVYTISHDLRAPLVSMDGFYSLLKRESQDQLGEQGQHYLERIRANVAHMNTLVTELLELSRIGRVVGPEEEIDVGVLLREIEEGLALKLEQEGVEFVVQQPLPAVRGDRGRIRQVFANLIENAVKFRNLERGLRIEVGCEEERGFYRFHVRDNGIGILPQYQEQIFEPFRQLDRGVEGVGMGLALVKRIVAYHRGRFWVESELGKGSTFYFTIPDRTNDDVRSAKYDRRLTRKRRGPMKGESK